jgi:hypothetical protein
LIKESAQPAHAAQPAAPAAATQAHAAQAVQATETTVQSATTQATTETTTMHAEQTLHDFVLNLLSDSQALTAFEQDPGTVLDHAGLAGISAVDVQEVIPLVVDMVPQADALTGVLDQLPVDSLGSGQLGAIQSLQFVTQALGGLPALDTGALSVNEGAVSGLLHVTSDGHGGVWGLGELNTPLADGALSVTGDVEHGLTAAVWDATSMGSGTGTINLPGLDSLPGLSGGLPGLENLPVLGSLGNLGGLPSGFSAVSDVTDVLDSQSSMTSSVSTASTLVNSTVELTTGALANPAALVNAVNDPGAAVSALTGTAESYASFAAQALPSPAGEIAGQVVQTTSSVTGGVVGDVTENLHTSALSSVTGALPTGEVSHVLAPVQGIVGEVTGGLTGQLGGGALNGVTGNLTGSLTDPTHAVSTVTSTVTSTVSTVQDTVSHTVGSVASQSVVGDLTGSAGVGSASASTTDHSASGGLLGDLGHVTDILHLPGL